MSVIKVATMKILWSRTPQLSSKTEVSISLNCQLFSYHYTAVRNQELFEKHLCNQGISTMKNGRLLLRKGSHHMQPPERETIIKMLKTHKDYKHLGHMRPHV